jgi:hypothetical protein
VFLFLKTLKISMSHRKSRKNRQHNGQKTEEQTTQWPKEKVQKDKQRPTKHTYKTKDRVTRTPLKTWSEFRCSGRVSSFFSTVVYFEVIVASDETLISSKFSEIRTPIKETKIFSCTRNETFTHYVRNSIVDILNY